MVLVVVGRVHDLVPGVAQLPVGKLLIALGAASLLVRRDVGRRLSAFGTRQGNAVKLLLMAIVVSVPFSIYKTGSVNYFIEVVPSLIATQLIVVASVWTSDDLTRLFRAFSLVPLILGAFLLAGYGSEEVGSLGVRASITGMYDPNDLALVASVSLGFTIWLLSDSSRRWRIIGAASTLFALLLVVRSGSRGGFLAVVAVLIPLLLSARSILPRWLRLAALPVLVIASTQLPDSFKQRITTLTALDQDYNTSSVTGRVEIWKRGVGYFLRRPLTGVGFGEFGTAEGRWAASRGSSQGFKWSAAHNMYVQVAAECGVAGIIGFLGIFLPTVRHLRRPRRVRDGPVTLEPPDTHGRALAIATVAFLIAGTFLSAAYSPVAIVLAALTIAHAGIVRRERVRLRTSVRLGAASGAPDLVIGAVTTSRRMGL